MDTQYRYQELRFERARRRFPPRLVPIVALLAAFALLWQLIPHGMLFWLLLALLAALGWAASYGWRQPLAHVIALLRRLEQG